MTRNKKLLRPVLLMLVASVSLLCAACVAIATTGNATHSVTLVYSGNLDGELEPCGCSEGGNKGGIKRRANMVDQLRAENPDLFLISTGGLLVSELPQDKLKSDYILKGLALLNYDAIGVQWPDLSYGDSFLQAAGLPFVVSNLRDSPLQPSRVIEKDGVKLAYFQWIDPGEDPQRQMHTISSAISDVSILRSQLAQAKQQGAVIVLATTLGLEQAQKEFSLNNIDVLLIKSAYEAIGAPQKIDNTLVLQPGSRGMRLGRVKFQLSPGNKIAQWQHDVFALPPEVGDAERMNAWYAEYNDRVKQDYEKRVALRKSLQTAESPYAGEKACETCHQKEHDKWFETPHSEAFYKLQDVNKAFDPDCIGCHTVGFEKAGGFIDPAITPDLIHVQCESCHGAAKAHATSLGKTPVANSTWKPRQMCAQCHEQKHSPDFNFDTYWPKIAHGTKTN